MNIKKSNKKNKKSLLKKNHINLLKNLKKKYQNVNQKNLQNQKIK